MWGLADFEPVSPGTNKIVLFSEEDFYYRNCSANDWDHYFVEAFLLPKPFITYGVHTGQGKGWCCREGSPNTTATKDSARCFPRRYAIFENQAAR